MEQYFNLIDAKHRFRDPIYGFIYLTDAEKAVIDTPLFQRLRRVHQLALTKYVYPSAEHSRFVHSLGVMHCATLILAGIHGHKHSGEITSDPKPKRIKTLRFAALLHDIGHLPFSHAVEEQWLQGAKHEDLSQFIIENYPPITEKLEAEDINPKDVSSLLAKKPPAKLRLLHEIVSGQLDADRADYLLRDAHLCGARYGEYDFARFLQIFCANEDEDGKLLLFIDESDLHVAESLLIARYHYNLQIPFHRTRTGYDLALKRFIKDFGEYRKPFTVREGKLEGVDLDRFIDLDDCEIMEKIKKERRENHNEWSQYLLRAKHLVPIIDTSSTSSNGPNIFKNFVRQLGEDTSFTEGEHYFTKLQKVEIIKGNRRASEKKSNRKINPAPNFDMIMLRSCEGKGRAAEYVDIRQRSWIFGQFADDPPTLHRVYVTPEKEGQARKILAKTKS